MNTAHQAHHDHLPPPLGVVAGGRGRGRNGQGQGGQHPVAVISLSKVTGGYHSAWSLAVVVRG